MTFTIAEYRARIAALRAAMAEKKADAALYFGQEAANYLCGFYTHGHFAFTALCVPKSGEPFMVLRQMEDAAAALTTWVQERHLYLDHEDPVALTRQSLAAHGLDSGRIMIDMQSWYLTVERYAALKAALPEVEFVPEDRAVERLRLVKSDTEMQCLAKAAQIVDRAVEAAIQASKPGVSEREVAVAMTSARILAGSSLPIDGVLTTGERTSQGHGGWTDRVLGENDQFLYEFHGIYNHYWARSLRSGRLGESSPKELDTAAALIAAQDAMIARLVPGASSTDADRACREPLIRAGLKSREEFTRRIGYSIGLNFRPTPGEMVVEFSPRMDFEIKAGMVFMLLLSHDGVGIGDTVAVTPEGPRLLTRLPRRFYSGKQGA